LGNGRKLTPTTNWLLPLLKNASQKETVDDDKRSSCANEEAMTITVQMNRGTSVFFCENLVKPYKITECIKGLNGKCRKDNGKKEVCINNTKKSKIPTDKKNVQLDKKNGSKTVVKSAM